MRVLIAEDDRVSRTLLKTHLEKWGHEPVTTVDGSEAWVALQADDDLYLRMVVAPVYASAELIHDRWPTEDSAIGRLVTPA
jgi:CheY-like chemotaxis protein